MSFSRIRDNNQGFTIVELLIVIVVIAILAAISVVAYTGIQNRANDAAVQNDLKNFAQVIQVWEIENDTTAVLTSASEASTSIGPGVTFAPNKNAHSATYAMYVCRQTSNPSNIVVGSRSASNAVFAHKVGGGQIAYPNPSGSITNGSWSNGATNCLRLLGLDSGSTDYTFAYGKGSAGTWTAWIR